MVGLEEGSVVDMTLIAALPSDYLDYTTKYGDTFDTLALEMYNDEFGASIIMNSNRNHIGTLIFEAGIHLRIPVFDNGVNTSALPPWRQRNDYIL
jgi:hypothetical protein